MKYLLLILTTVILLTSCSDKKEKAQLKNRITELEYQLDECQNGADKIHAKMNFSFKKNDFNTCKNYYQEMKERHPDSELFSEVQSIYDKIIKEENEKAEKERLLAEKERLLAEKQEKERLEAEKQGKLIDTRDGKVYKIVEIGTQTWMAENLKFKPNGEGFWEIKGNINNCGYFYNWETAKNVCPTGWRLPHQNDWDKLKRYIGNNSADALKSKSHWISSANGKDTYGFNGLPCGYISVNGNHIHFGEYAYWWTNVENGSKYAWYFYIQSDYNNLLGDNFGRKAEGFSVRCVKR